MILVKTVVDLSASALDAEQDTTYAVGRYTFSRDYLPAIQFAQTYTVSIFNSVFSQNKLSEESLRDLHKVTCFLTSSRSRVNVDDAQATDGVWTITSVQTNITYEGTLPTQSTLTSSVVGSGMIFLNGTKPCKRLTWEEFFNNQNNPMEAGNTIVTALDFIDYAYLNYADYGSTKNEIQISPSLVNKPVAISYLKNPATITAIGDGLEFPEGLTNMFVDYVLRFISYKQGDSTNLYGVAKQDENNLIKLLS